MTAGVCEGVMQCNQWFEYNVQIHAIRSVTPQTAAARDHNPMQPQKDCDNRYQ